MQCQFKDPAHDEVYSIQHYVIMCVSDLRQVSGFLWILMILITYATCHKKLNDFILCIAFCNNIMPLLKVELVRVMVFNGTFNNISSFSFL
jgi:hypothetical protein